MCHPLIFGYKDSKTAYCTTRSGSASVNCTRESDSSENTKRLLAIWDNPANAKAIEQYQRELNALCDTTNEISKDVQKSCQVIADRFDNKSKANLVLASHKRMNEQKKINTIPGYTPTPAAPGIRRGR